MGIGGTIAAFVAYDDETPLAFCLITGIDNVPGSRCHYRCPRLPSNKDPHGGLRVAICRILVGLAEQERHHPDSGALELDGGNISHLGKGWGRYIGNENLLPDNDILAGKPVELLEGLPPQVWVVLTGNGGKHIAFTHGIELAIPVRDSHHRTLHDCLDIPDLVYADKRLGFQPVQGGKGIQVFAGANDMFFVLHGLRICNLPLNVAKSLRLVVKDYGIRGTWTYRGRGNRRG